LIKTKHYKLAKKPFSECFSSSLLNKLKC